MPNDRNNSATEQRPVPSQAEGEDNADEKNSPPRPVPSQAEGEDPDEGKAAKPDHTE